MSRAPLLVEIGCEEIPARMIAGASRDLADRLTKILGQAGLGHGAVARWAGPRRLAVRIESVEPRQPDREERVLGPGVEVAFDKDGAPTRAARGFARKLGIEPQDLQVVETERGRYVGIERKVMGRSVDELLAEQLPGAVAQMAFPKTMRWGAGTHRWVRPVHWVLALHGDRPIPLELFGIASAPRSAGHRFLHEGDVEVPHADAYAERLHEAFVVVDPGRRRDLLAHALDAAAQSVDGAPVADPGLLTEIADLVEWPGVVVGRFDETFLSLPRELLVTTLRFHQKCFSVQSADGRLLPAFLAVANTDRDPSGHVRRGNEWVVGGRLDDAAFFWKEDLAQPLAARSEKLHGVGLHPKLGSYADKAQRLERIAVAIADKLGLDAQVTEHCREAARLAKNDLVTGTVGEFPELQGQVGGLMLAHEGRPAGVSRGVYEHYRPAGPDDPAPESVEGAVVSLADKLDTLGAFLGVGEVPTGSRDPYGLRRAANGVFRVVRERELRLSLRDLCEVAGAEATLLDFLRERLVSYLKDSGSSANEIAAVLRQRVQPDEMLDWPLGDVRSRLDAISVVRGREDFRKLVELTERVDTILVRNAERLDKLAGDAAKGYREKAPSAAALDRLVEEQQPRLEKSSSDGQYDDVVECLATFIEPVERFFADVLVIDEKNPAATIWRVGLLDRLRASLTRYFDIRELAGEADRRS